MVWLSVLQSSRVECGQMEYSAVRMDYSGIQCYKGWSGVVQCGLVERSAVRLSTVRAGGVQTLWGPI